MRANPLLTATAVAWLAVGIGLVFAGEELLALAGATGTLHERALAQLLGAALFGLGMLDWTSRHTATGGIYGRPLVIANLTTAATSALMLVHLVREEGARAPLLVPLALFAAVAVAFGAQLFRSPRPLRPD